MYIIVNMSMEMAPLVGMAAHLCNLSERVGDTKVQGALTDGAIMAKALGDCDRAIYVFIASDLLDGRSRSTSTEHLRQMLMGGRNLEPIADEQGRIVESQLGYYFAAVLKKSKEEGFLKNYIDGVLKRQPAGAVFPMLMISLAWVRSCLKYRDRPEGFAKCLCLALADSALDSKSDNYRDFWDLSWYLRQIDSFTLRELEEA